MDDLSARAKQLEVLIAERAKQIVDRWETVSLQIHSEIRTVDAGPNRSYPDPYWRLKGALEKAGEELAPDWERHLAESMGAPPEMMLGRYCPQETRCRWCGRVQSSVSVCMDC